jgi:hypothetical protein
MFVDGSSDEALNAEVDAAYRAKYYQYRASCPDPMIAQQARATMFKLVPSGQVSAMSSARQSLRVA